MENNQNDDNVVKVNLQDLAKAKDINAAAKQLSIAGKITINLSNLVEKQ